VSVGRTLGSGRGKLCSFGLLREGRNVVKVRPPTLERPKVEQRDRPVDGSTAPKRFFIHTFGCQMNEHDSARMAEILARLGMVRVEQADEADLILLNTCAVRAKAEQKVLSALGRYREVKLARGARIGVAGCVAQQEKQRLLSRAPYIDFVMGPDAIAQLPDILARVETGRVLETEFEGPEDYAFLGAEKDAVRGKVSDFVTVMKGCQNFCAYCVVPFTRGPEQSRPVEDVLAEVRKLVDAGLREVTLLGQNVNSYAGGTDFADLLRQVCAVEGLWRVRFTTSHPKDLSQRLVDAVAALPSVMPHFHLPVQSGSDRVLERMRRGYTVAAYLERLEKLVQARPGVAVTTDIIVGFPGETDEDFEATLALVERARYDNVFSFVYSNRPNTLATKMEKEWGEVPYTTKIARLERLQARVREHSLERAQAQVGRRVEVLVEGPSKTDPTRRFGRTPENRVVNFEGSSPAGALVEVELTSASHNALFGSERARCR